MKTIQMEWCIANYFDYIRNIIVPNVSWGLFLHECDLLIASKSGYLTEVEIKVSKSDLKKDKLKKHGHINQRIKKLYFAIPDYIDKDFALEHIPDRAGLIIVDETGNCIIEKEADVYKKAEKLTNLELLKLAKLGSMRIWGLKQKLTDLT